MKRPNIIIPRHKSEDERDALLKEVYSLKQSLSQKDNEINSLNSVISYNNSNISQKDSEIYQLKLKVSNNQVQIGDNSKKDIEINQLKQENLILKENLDKHTRLTSEKVEMLAALKVDIEELKLDKIDLRKDKFILAKENKELKKEILEFSLLSHVQSVSNFTVDDMPENNITKIIENVIGKNLHTQESHILNNDISLSGNLAESNFTNLLDEL